jgi:hypothetical protein
MIRNKMMMALLLAMAMAMALPMASANAQSPKGAGRPAFTVGDHAIIDRNATLKGLVERDPWLVRRVLDAIQAADQGSQRSAEPMARSAIMTDQTPTPSRNPDLDHLERSSPEAAHDLFQLIKKASGSSKNKSQPR